MRKIAVINLKGGVGKTTTTLNIAVGLARKNRRVLLVDMDPQANLTGSLFLAGNKTVYDLLINKEHPSDVIINVDEFLDAIIADKKLADAEMIMAGMPSRETILKRSLESIFNYDYVLIDCPPSNGLLNYNSLLYADEAFVPVSTDYLGVVGLRRIVEIIDEINELFDHNVEISTVIPTMYDIRSKICKESLEEIRKGFNGEVVAPIRVNSKLKEAPRSGTSIFDYSKKSRGAKDYSRLVNQILNREEFY
jgi:chromosome partitioning protein